MCAVSMVGDHYRDKFSDPWSPYPWNPGPLIPRSPGVPAPALPSPGIGIWPPAAISRQEFDALKKEVEDMKALLIRAKKYDDETGQHDCEMDEKVALLKKVAELVGVSLEEVFGQK